MIRPIMSKSTDTLQLKYEKYRQPYFLPKSSFCKPLKATQVPALALLCSVDANESLDVVSISPESGKTIF